MSRTAGDVRARATEAALDRARGVAPAPELVPPTPAEESTVQRDSRPRFFTWARRCGWLGNGLMALLVSVITGTSASDGRRTGVWWFGLALVFGSALVLEAVLIPHVWPGLMPVGAAGLPVRREWPLEVPAPTEEPAWPWPAPVPLPVEEPEPEPEPVEVPA